MRFRECAPQDSYSPSRGRHPFSKIRVQDLGRARRLEIILVNFSQFGFQHFGLKHLNVFIYLTYFRFSSPQISSVPIGCVGCIKFQFLVFSPVFKIYIFEFPTSKSRFVVSHVNSKSDSSANVQNSSLFSPQVDSKFLIKFCSGSTHLLDLVLEW